MPNTVFLERSGRELCENSSNKLSQLWHSLFVCRENERQETKALYVIYTYIHIYILYIYAGFARVSSRFAWLLLSREVDPSTLPCTAANIVSVQFQVICPQHVDAVLQ